jgi:hypothetical protein
MCRLLPSEWILSEGRLAKEVGQGEAPTLFSGPGEIDWHITLKGDAVVTATDSSGNSASVSCKVPPPPK